MLFRRKEFTNNLGKAGFSVDPIFSSSPVKTAFLPPRRFLPVVWIGGIVRPRQRAETAGTTVIFYTAPPATDRGPAAVYSSKDHARARTPVTWAEGSWGQGPILPARGRHAEYARKGGADGV